MKKTLAEIAKIIKGEVVGDENLIITGLNGIKEAKDGDLTFVENPKYIPLVNKTAASAIITPKNLEVPGKSIIRVDNPSLAFSKVISSLIDIEPWAVKGIHKTAIIPENVILGKNVSIGPYAVIEENVKIDDYTIIGSGTFIGNKTRIGKGCLIYPNVTIRERIIIGDNVSIHSGTIIGSDGFGFAQVDGLNEKIPQIGIVSIEDDVEIGANVTIDRARFDRTVIGKGTKIDNLVQIAHNVIVGENCIIVAQVGISGSVNVGKGAILAGQSGVAGHISIGEGAIVAAQSGVTRSIKPKEIVSGYPSRPHEMAKKINACVQRLPKYVEIILELEKKVKDLEERVDKLKKG